LQREIERRAYEHQHAVESQQRIVVGVNEYKLADELPIAVARVDPALEREQVTRVRALRARRNQGETDRALRALQDAARGSDNLCEPILVAVKANATVGEIADQLRTVFGEYQPH
jgi:methylmalonyl-CoA mutase N-terminal domain/subunit